jgi:hypothetical protein
MAGLPAPAGVEDLHLALYVCYELHYRGFAGVHEEWEWEPSLVGLRRELEVAVEHDLVAHVGPSDPIDPIDVEAALQEVVAAGSEGPSLSRFMETEGTVEQFRELCVHRSAYQLKEADPHTWAIPRLRGRAKAALLRIQADEYGNGRTEEMHCERFAVTMAAVGLDPSYGAYLDHIPGVTLATVNLVSMFGLHRRWRGALVGHLAVFEMTSVGPMSRYAGAIRRLHLPARAAAFYDVHVTADTVHQIVASRDLASGFARDEPEQAGDVLFGARAVMEVEARFAAYVSEAWEAGRSSLRLPLGAATRRLAAGS